MGDDKIKIHARVTREIEIDRSQLERLINYLNGCVEHSEIEDIKEMFTNGINPGNYENGYIPEEWLKADFANQVQVVSDEGEHFLLCNQCRTGDIDL